ncbi:DUF4232 domain-containing protein [Dactylosporangium sp. McL0621]|uniref:DUF4232 domain-containing protein n=1 Tax=Dactylosporangium sp. McL0621 TaxID=3415678 RepID=UPI003CF9FE8F
MRPALVTVLLAAGVTAGCAGTGTSTGAGPAPGPASGPASGAASSPAPNSPATGSPMVGSPAVGGCTKALGLRTTLGVGGAAGGHRRMVLVFTNGGAAACRLTGYPGVAGLDAGGKQVAQARRTLSGYAGGPGQVGTVALAPGGTAEAVVEGTGADPQTGAGCTGFAGLLVTAPDDTASTRLDLATDTCADFQVHPVTAGTG